MSEFVLTHAAKADLLKILAYLECDNPSAVPKVVDALDDAMQLLADNPGIGHLRPDLTPHDVRFWSVFRYLVIYRPETGSLTEVANDVEQEELDACHLGEACVGFCL